MFIKKRLLSLLLVGLFLTISVLFAQGNQLNMPKGFQGIYHGMSLVEFLKIRPNVRVNPMKTGRYEKADITKLNQTLEEGIKNMPFEGGEMLGLYSFKEGRLDTLVVIWEGAFEKMRDLSNQFVKERINNWGRDFEAKVVVRGETQMPALIWKKNKVLIGVNCSAEPLEGKGFIVMSLSSLGDPFSLTVLQEKTVDARAKKMLFEKIGVQIQEENKE